MAEHDTVPEGQPPSSSAAPSARALAMEAPAAATAPLPETNKARDWCIQQLLDKISRLPKTPGVYLFKDLRGTVLYIGKAKDLRSRVSTYFQQSADLLA